MLQFQDSEFLTQIRMKVKIIKTQEEIAISSKSVKVPQVAVKIAALVAVKPIVKQFKVQDFIGQVF